MTNPRVLKTAVCSVGEGQRIALSNQNSRSCLCREKSIATASIKGDVSLGVSFVFKFYCLKDKNYWVMIFLHGKLIFKALLMGGDGWVGIAEATVEETIA